MMPRHMVVDEFLLRALKVSANRSERRIIMSPRICMLQGCFDCGYFIIT